MGVFRSLLCYFDDISAVCYSIHIRPKKKKDIFMIMEILKKEQTGEK